MYFSSVVLYQTSLIGRPVLVPHCRHLLGNVRGWDTGISVDQANPHTDEDHPRPCLRTGVFACCCLAARQTFKATVCCHLFLTGFLTGVHPGSAGTRRCVVPSKSVLQEMGLV